MRVITRETETDLPTPATALGGLHVGDIAFTRDVWAAYVWDGTQWTNFALGGGMNESADYTATGTGPEILVFGRSVFSLQVTGVGAAATAWDVRLEGSVDGISWTTILTHVTGTGNGGVLFTGGNRYPVDRVRINVTALTLAPASAITVSFEAVP